MSKLESMLKSNELHVRIQSLLIVLAVAFGSSTICSMFVCCFMIPREFLLNIKSLAGLTTMSKSTMPVVLALLSNVFSITIITVANQFKFPGKDTGWIPLGYRCLMVLYALNGIKFGAWFVTATSQIAPSLTSMLLIPISVLSRSSLCDMTGKLLAIGATARVAANLGTLVKVAASERLEQKVPAEHDINLDTSLTKPEEMTVYAGLILITIGAFLESGFLFT